MVLCDEDPSARPKLEHSLYLLRKIDGIEFAPAETRGVSRYYLVFPQTMLT